MVDEKSFFCRKLDEGMGMAVAKRTYLRAGETWGDIAMRVAEGNCMLAPVEANEQFELTKSIAKATILPAGRHLQHGDKTQKDRNIEVFSNCSTSCSSFVKFYLLLNGSGVGRMYNDELMLVDWHNMPDVFVTLDHKHADFNEFIELVYKYRIYHELEKSDMLDKHPEFDSYWLALGYELYEGDLRRLKSRKDDNPSKCKYYQVEDSREGWAKALEIVESMAFYKQEDFALELDFSAVRKKGSPIGGMQNRPASGPGYTAYAFYKISKIKRNIFSYFDGYLKQEVEWIVNADPWKQTILIDHIASECVANGGARRSARIAVKYWKDPGILDFITLKRDFKNSCGESILWSANNSVGVDQEFWEGAKSKTGFAYKVFQAIVKASYEDGTGEPGIVNLDKLTANEEGIDDLSGEQI